ncbi:MAG: hypothetical protein RJS97_08880 [Parvibaculaceae bacterium]
MKRADGTGRWRVLEVCQGRTLGASATCAVLVRRFVVRTVKKVRRSGQAGSACQSPAGTAAGSGAHAEAEWHLSTTGW